MRARAQLPALLFARIVTGVFGGVIGSIVLAIATDLFPLQIRGRVMGVVQTAFSVSQVLGVPAGIYLANLWNWHVAFLALVLIASPIGLVIVLFMKPVSAHLALKQESSPWAHLIDTVVVPKHLLALPRRRCWSPAATCSCRSAASIR